MSRFDKTKPLQPKGALPFRVEDTNTERNLQDVMRQIRELQDTTPEFLHADHLWETHATDPNAFQLKLRWFANKITFSVRVEIAYKLNGADQSLPTFWHTKGSPLIVNHVFSGFEQDFVVRLFPMSKVEVEDKTGQPLTEPSPELIDDRARVLEFDGALDVRVDIDPRLDEDNKTLFLIPNMVDFTKSIRYFVKSGSAPTLAEVQAGSVSTAANVAVYSFTAAEETVYVGVLPYTDTGGSQGQGALVVVPWKYSPGNDIPTVSWLPATPSGPGKEKVRLILVDDGDQVALYYRTYTKGALAPAYTRIPASGFQADPIVQEVEVNKPAEGAANVVLETYGVDAAGIEGKLVVLEFDGNAKPSGDFKIRVDETGAVFVTPVSMDTDTGSWRFRASLTAYSDPLWNDAASDEFKGNAFGAEVALGAAFNVQGAKTIFVSGYFLRTSSTAGSAQDSSLRSPNVRVSQTGGKGSGYSVTPFLDKDGNVKVNLNAESDLSFRYAHSTSSFPTAETSGAINLSNGQYTLDPGVKLESGQTYYISVWFYSQAGAAGTRSARQTGQITYGATTLPYFSGPQWFGLARTADFAVFANDPLGRSMTVHVWSNKAGDASPNPNGTADGSFTGVLTGTQLSASTQASNGSYPLDNIPYAKNQEKYIYLEIVTSDGRTSGKKEFKVQSLWDTFDPDGRIANAAAFAAGIEPITVVPSTPTSFVTQQVFNTSTGKMMKWNGSSYTAAITGFSDLTGTIGAAQITGQVITGDNIFGNTITAGHLNGAIITADYINSTNGGFNKLFVSDKLLATNVYAQYLSAFSANLGSITAGQMYQDTGYGRVGISLNTAVHSSWASYISFTATDYFIYGRGGNFWLDHVGNAFFRGEIQATSGTFSGSLSSATGTLYGSLYLAQGHSQIYFALTNGGTYDGGIFYTNNAGYTAMNFQAGGGYPLSLRSDRISVLSGGIEYGSVWRQFVDGVAFKLYAANYATTYTFNTNGWADAVQWNSISDGRLKQNKLRINKALDIVDKLNGYTYDASEEGKKLGLGKNNRREMGLVAQEVQAVLPEAVNKIHNSDYLGVAYGSIVPVLVEAIKELRAEVELLKKQPSLT